MNEPNSPDQIRANQQEKGFREKGKLFIDKTMPLISRVDELGNLQELSGAIKKFIHNLGQEIASNIELWQVVENHKSIEKPTDQNLEDYRKKLRAYFDHTPLANLVRKVAGESSEIYEQVMDLLAAKIARYAQAVHRADEVNNATNRAGQVTYHFEKYLDLSVQTALEKFFPKLPADIDLLNLDASSSQAQADLIAKLSNENRLYSLLNWVSQTARQVRSENLKIFSTPETNSLLARLEAISKQKNGLGGAILFGPPGTGKTELLVEKNRRLGFDSRVISIHHFSDYAQLLGERPISVNMDQATSQVQRLKVIHEVLSQMTGEQQLAFVKNKFNEGTDSWKKFLNLANLDNPSAIDGKNLDENVAKQIVESLSSKLQTDMTNIGLGMQDGLDEQTAWVRGEIIQAFDQGQMPILDEMDKGSSHSLEGISRLLNLSPGSSMMLGDREYKIPSWATIDGTANAMNLAPFLHDRFAPNVIYVDYPSPQETMLRSLVWLTNEQGLIDLSAEKQEQLFGLIIYVFPEIQSLYPETIEHTLSNRGIRKFCQMITNGETIVSALNELLLKPGALTNTEQGFRAIQKILDRFPSLTSSNVAMEAALKTNKSDLINSTVFNSCVEGFLPFDAESGSTAIVNLTPEQRLSLLEDKETITENTNQVLDTKVNSTLAIEEKNGNGSLTVRVDGKLLSRVLLSKKADDESKNIIASADRTGRIALVRNQGNLNLINMATGVVEEFLFNDEQESYVVSPDGRYLLHKYADKLSLVPVDSFFKRSNDGPIAKIDFVDEDGEKVICRQIDVSDDGNFLQVETTANETFIINLELVYPWQTEIMLTKPFVEDGGWQLTRGNMLVKADSEKAYLLKA